MYYRPKAVTAKFLTALVVDCCSSTLCPHLPHLPPCNLTMEARTCYSSTFVTGTSNYKEADAVGVDKTLYNKNMSQEKGPTGSKSERALRFLRNINVVGAVALGGAAVVFPEFAPVLLPLAALDIAQAGFFEVAARWAKKRRAPNPAPATG